MEAPYVFISYSTKDQKYADLINNTLQDNGLNTWIATHDLHGGESFANKITTAVHGCKAFIFVLSANSGRGGNPDGWFYAWDNELYSMDISYVFSANIDLNIKDTIQRQVPLRWVNVGIEGDTIARGVLSQPIVVYNTPATPILKVKGNGTSNIYIVDDMGMTETELWANGYSFRFWDGNTMMAEIDNQRWYRYNNVPNDAWVQSIWYYDDGFVCEGEIAKPAVVNEIVSSKTTVSVYRIDGELIMKRTLDEDDSIDNMSEGLETGLYIIRYENNGTSDTYKVVIK